MMRNPKSKEEQNDHTLTVLTWAIAMALAVSLAYMYIN